MADPEHEHVGKELVIHHLLVSTYCIPTCATSRHLEEDTSYAERHSLPSLVFLHHRPFTVLKCTPLQQVFRDQLPSLI